jgi:hypothetical protein
MRYAPPVVQPKTLGSQPNQCTGDHTTGQSNGNHTNDLGESVSDADRLPGFPQPEGPEGWLAHWLA